MESTKFASITDKLAEMEFASDTEAQALLEAMEGYKETYHRTYESLRKVPAFAELWDALSAAARFTTRGQS